MNDATEDDPPVEHPVPVPAVGPVPRPIVGLIATLNAGAIVFVAVADALSSDFDGYKTLFILAMVELGVLGVDAGKWLRR